MINTTASKIEIEKQIDLILHQFSFCTISSINLSMGPTITITQALYCHLGGFVNARHDNIRDASYSLLRPSEDCNRTNTATSHQLARVPQISKNLNDRARLDIRACGFWRNGQNAFFDVRITNLDNRSQQDASIKAILRKNDMDKTRQYNCHVMEMEHGSFTPLVFTMSRVMSHEFTIFHKSLAEKIVTKRGERYEEIVRYIRVKFSFLKATLLCLKGSRSRRVNTVPNEDFRLTLNELGL